MSFLSGLLKGVGTALSFAPVPGAGAASKALSMIGKGSSIMGDVAGALKDGSKVAGDAAAASAAARQQQAQNILTQNNQANQQYATHQGAEMQAGNLNLGQKQFEEGARGGRAKQALLASLLGGGFKPTEINVPGIKNANITGGLAASLSAPGAQASMAELMKQALAAQMQQGSPEGEQFHGGQVLAAPTMAALPQAGKLENTLGGVGLGGSLLSSVLANIKKTSEKKQPQIVGNGGGDYGGET